MDPTQDPKDQSVKKIILPAEPLPMKKEISGKTRHLLGWKPDKPDHRDLIFKAPPPKLRLQPIVDLSLGKMPVMEDQADIGSCVANSSTDTFEFLYIMAGKVPPQLSRLYVYYWCRYLDGVNPTEDSGTTIRTAMKCLASYGACLETTWPYATEKFSVRPTQAMVQEGQNHQILNYYRTPALAYIKLCLSEGYPIVFGFSVPETLYSDETMNTGVIAYPSSKETIIGGHAVMMVGYDETKRRVKFKNSWGPNWGDKGYGYLPYDFITNGLASDFWTIRKAEL